MTQTGDKLVLEGVLNFVACTGMSLGIFDVDNTSLRYMLTEEGWEPVARSEWRDPWHVFEEWGRVRITIECLDDSARFDDLYADEEQP